MRFLVPLLFLLGAEGTQELSIQYEKPSSFPGVPSLVVKELEKRKCSIPQAVELKRPNNLIRGQFLRRRQTTWAALCSIGGESRIIVLGLQGEILVTSLAEGKDSDSRAIFSAKPDGIRAADRALGNPEPLPPLDHDGIQDAIVGKASSIHYFYRGKWLELAGSD